MGEQPSASQVRATVGDLEHRSDINLDEEAQLYKLCSLIPGHAECPWFNSWDLQVGLGKPPA